MKHRWRPSTITTFALLALVSLALSAFPQSSSTINSQHEYLWAETENMRGFATQPNGEPILNPSWMNPSKAQASGWGMNGTGTSAEWTQGGGSEWNSAAASADETQGTIYQDIEVPRAGEYKIWVRYADWANKTENFVVRITRGDRELFRHEFGAKEIIDPHDELSMYWGWAFTWDGAPANLEKGAVRISIGIEKAAEARRHVDCVLLTNDLAYIPDGRRKPDFAAMRYLREWSTQRPPLAPLINTSYSNDVLAVWQIPKVAGRDFMMPWNIATDFWSLQSQPAEARPLYPFNAEPIEQFVQKYKGARDVPIFSSRLVVPVIYINSLPEYLKEGSPFLRYLRETKVPFAVLINYGAAQMSDQEAQAAWTLLNGELKDQFVGWISGESIGHVWASAEAGLKLLPSMSRKEMLDTEHAFYTNAIARKWAELFHTQTGPMWDKLIPAQSTSSTSFAHALSEWGVRMLGVEIAAVQPMFGMRMAFTRGAARQYGGSFLYYHAPNFGDTATTFTKSQNFAGPDNFFHSRYGATMGPSLSWYRKSYYYSYMAGASAIYLEQGGDQFFKPGPGEHEFQLNPLGRITDEFIRFAEKHPARGTPYTPVAFLLDPAHGWDMTDYPQWPFGVSQINRSDRALRELFGVAYYPGLVVEGEPATGDRQAFVNGIFGDIFDVLVASDVQSPTPKVQSQSEYPTVKEGSNIVQSPKSKVQSQSNTSESTGALPARNAAGTRKRSTAKTKEWDYEGSNVNKVSTPESASPVPPRAGAVPTPLAFPASRPPVLPLEAYRAIVVGGHIDWTPQWIQKLADYVKSGGAVVLNAAQIKDLPADLLGIRLTGTSAEADTARCLSPGEASQNLSGQLFRYEKAELKGALTLVAAENGDPLVTVNKVGKGSIIFSTLPDLLGEDERITPFAAHMLAHVFADAMPIAVHGDVEYLVNRTETGWVVTLFNNRGVYKPAQGMAQVDRSAYVTATISLRSQRIQNATEWTSEKNVEVKNQSGESGVTVTIAPGGVSVVELRPTMQ
ncbi:MAG: hypothetical protein M3R69_18180 [Acidobacteriota bacterium]|nr:hypothetical protein [Acidobacteriota bacterium]